MFTIKTLNAISPVGLAKLNKNLFDVSVDADAPDGILVRMQRKADPLRSAEEVVNQTQWPLLGATLIAVIAFAPIGLSPDSTGEFCRSLFTVVGISLLLSWVLAVTVTPLAAISVLGNFQAGPDIDPYDSKYTRFYVKILTMCLDNRKKTITVLGILLAALSEAADHRGQRGADGAIECGAGAAARRGDGSCV